MAIPYAVGYEPNRMKLALSCIAAFLSSSFLVMKAEAAGWNLAWLVLAVAGLILVVLLSINCKVCVAFYVVGPLAYTAVEQD
eukprot:8575217-Pyramimonas_sp.AAC.1